MKILQINAFHYKLGGSETVYFNTINLLERKGQDVICFALKWPENGESLQAKYFPESKATRKGPLKSVNNGVNYFYHFEAVQKIEQLIINEKPDLAQVHLFWGQITPSVLPVLKKYHIPIVFTIHEYRMVCPAYTFRNGRGLVCEQCVGRHFYRCIINKCTKGSYGLSAMMAAEQYFRNLFFYPAKYIDGLIYVSNFAKEVHEKYMPELKDKKNMVLYNMSDYIFSTPKLTGVDRYFLYFGRLSYEKGIETLVTSFAELSNCKLKIVGTGAKEKELKHYVAKNNLRNIDFLGYKTGQELVDIIRNAYFIVVPSEWYENNPMTIIEGYSSATPVIGARIGGIPEIIDDCKTGYLFTPGSKEELKACVVKADALEREEYAAFSRNALNFALDHFNPADYYSYLENFYLNFIDVDK